MINIIIVQDQHQSTVHFVGKTDDDDVTLNSCSESYDVIINEHEYEHRHTVMLYQGHNCDVIERLRIRRRDGTRILSVL